jgi:hypothetical protein
MQTFLKDLSALTGSSSSSSSSASASGDATVSSATSSTSTSSATQVAQTVLQDIQEALTSYQAATASLQKAMLAGSSSGLSLSA